MKRYSFLLMAGWSAAVMLGAACSKDEPVTSDGKPREEPTFTQSSGGTTQPSGTLPAGHPPLGDRSTGLPSGHPPIDATAGVTAPAGDPAGMDLKLDLPAEWEPRPARMMTLRVYTAPKAEGDPEDADIAISELRAKVPLQMNINRWCGQFDLPAGQTCETAAKPETLDGTQHPTTVVELAGTFKGRMGSGPHKPDYRMIAVEVVTPDRPYYITMVGPAKTVEKWKGPMLDAVKAAK